MKVAIFGATGRTGIPLVKQALDAGHEVIGFVRSPEKMPIQHDRLTLVQGDVMNREDVDRAITPDVDAVLSVLAPVKGSPPDMLPKAVDNILAAMKRHQIDRIIYMTGAGVDAPEDQPKLFNHFIKFALKTMAGDVLKQSEMAVNKIRNSDKTWTVVRAPMLTDGEHTGQYRVGWVGVNTGPRLARADAADFMLKLLKDEQAKAYLNKAPVISN